MATQTCSSIDRLKTELRKRSDSLSMLPAVALEALELAKDPECRIAEVASVVERDVKLATEILKLSNSVCFAASAPVASLRQAVVRLGLTQCRNLIVSSGAASLMKNVPLEQEWVREVMWQHSLRTATVCTAINQRLRLGFDGEEFTAGLLHDFGRLLLAIAAPDLFAKADPMSFNEDEEFLSRENEILGTDHCAFGAWFAEQNGLPRSLVAAIQLHHLPETHHPDAKLIALVATSDHLASHVQQHEQVEGYDVGLNRGAYALKKSGYPQILENTNGIVQSLLEDLVVQPEQALDQDSE